MSTSSSTESRGTETVEQVISENYSHRVLVTYFIRELYKKAYLAKIQELKLYFLNDLFLQLIGECFVKTAQAILSSRVYEPPAAGSKERNDKRSVWVSS